MMMKFTGPLLADICNQHQLILNGVNIDIKLRANNDEFWLITHPSGEQVKIELKGICLEVCHVNVDPSVYIAIERQLKVTPTIYPMLCTEMRAFNIPQGYFSESHENLFQSQVPTHIIVGLVDAQAIAGDYQCNPFCFQDFNIAKIGFSFDGKPTPHEPFKFNFKAGQYIEGLKSLYCVTRKWNENTDIPIDHETYRQGFALFGFEVNPTSSTNMTYVGRPWKGLTWLWLFFHKALKHPIIVIVPATLPETVQIDEFRNV